MQYWIMQSKQFVCKLANTSAPKRKNRVLEGKIAYEIFSVAIFSLLSRFFRFGAAECSSNQNFFVFL